MYSQPYIRIINRTTKCGMAVYFLLNCVRIACIHTVFTPISHTPLQHQSAIGIICNLCTRPVLKHDVVCAIAREAFAEKYAVWAKLLMVLLLLLLVERSRNCIINACIGTTPLVAMSTCACVPHAHTMRRSGAGWTMLVFIIQFLVLSISGSHAAAAHVSCFVYGVNVLAPF